jgi:hypothetical protein
MVEGCQIQEAGRAKVEEGAGKLAALAPCEGGAPEKSNSGSYRFRQAVPEKAGARPYHTLAALHKTCNFSSAPLLSALETGLQSRWVVNAG